jgi:capsular exopolysaccharide synthesis family protein
MSQVTKYRRPSPAIPAAVYAPQLAPVIDCAPADASVPIGAYFEILRRQLWKILCFVVVCTVGTYFGSSYLTPLYRATAVIDIDRSAPSGIVGEDLSRRTDNNDVDEFISTQVKLIQSSSVLRPVAEKYRLFERAQGSHQKEQPDAQTELAGPIVLRRLRVLRQPYTYLILISYESSDPKLASDVANAVANSYIERTFDVRARSSAGLSSFMERQLDELKAKMERSEHALARFQSELDVIDPVQKTNILSSRLLQLNTEYTNAQVDRVRKQSMYNSIQSGSLEAAQLSGQGEELARLVNQLNEASQHFAEIKSTYGSSHPEYQKAASRVSELENQLTESRKNIFNRVALDYKGASAREQMLQKAVAITKAEFDHLNGKSFEYQRLLQEAEADKKLYEELVGKIKEAGINIGFQNSNIRIADLALPPLRPVFPNTGLNVIAAFIFSTLLGTVIAVIAEKASTTVRDADESTRYFDTRIIGTLPFEKELPHRSIFAAAGGLVTGAARVPSNGILRPEEAEYAQMSPFEEAVRGLRNAIVLSNLTQNINSVLITSPGAGEGKTTTAVHLAIAHSAQRRRTLLIDADLRRPSIHKILKLSAEIGLSDVLVGDHTWREARISVPQSPYLDVILAGTPSYSAADLLGPMLNDLLDEFAQEYDLVLLDSAPFIGFAEALQMAAAVNGVVIVATAGKTSRKALELMLASLSWLQTNILGIVLNRTKENDAGNYGYKAYYRKGAGKCAS